MKIHEAVESGKAAAVKQSLEAGADVNARAALKRTPLHIAAKNGAEAIARLLLEHGAEVNAQDNKKYTALHHAAAAASLPVVEALLEHGADPAAKDTYEDTPLHKAAGAPATDKAAARVAIAEKLIKAGSPVNAVNYSGQTPLWHAAAQGNIKLVRSLLDRGADPSIQAKGQQGDAIDAARAYERTDVAALLEKHRG